MNAKDHETAARAKLLAMMGTPEGEWGPTVFVSHHLEELESDYWERYYGSSKPEAEEILGSLVLVNTWSSNDDENIDTFDFSLPGNVTNYLLSVRFKGDEIVDVSMES